MYAFALGLAATVAIITLGYVAERSVQRREPLLSVSQPVQALTLGVALGGPFVLENLDLIPVPETGGWDLVAALALSLALYVAASRLVGVGGGTGSGADGSGC